MNDTLIIGALIAFIVVCLIAIAFLNLRPRTENAPRSYPYQLRENFLSNAERSFYEVLYRAVGSDYEIFPKVRLADIVQVKPGTETWQSYFNQINQKHVDFLLCTADTLTPALVIELDDRSHLAPKTKVTDEFRDKVFRAAGLTTLRVPVRAIYNPRDLAAQVQASLQHR
jgi:hypothetical protein